MIKKTFRLWIFGLLLAASASAQNHTQLVAAYQYYFDTDPGVGIAGNGAIVPITPTANFNQTVAITTPALSAGLHTLYVRVQDEFGKWSTSERSLFYVQDVTKHTQTITAYQYYFDTDPGVAIAGNGAVVAVTSTSNFNQTLAIATPALSAGFHQLYVRTLDEFGKWSTPERSLFYVQQAATNNQIIAGEYYIDTDPGVGNGIPIPVPTPTDTVTTPLNIPIPVSLLNCNHNLFVRFKNADNRWSTSEGIVFKNPHKHARVVFNPIVAANTVYFETDTQNVTTVNWNFGDATTATVLRPVKTYSQAGNYNVRLIGGNPQCPNDTMIKTVTIAGIRPLECRTGCNNGVATMNINGGAFTASTTVKFKKAGFPDIIPTSLQFVNNTLMIAKFNLSGASIGLRDLEATIPGFGVYTLTDQFNVTAACNDSIAISYESANRYRTGNFSPTFTRIINKSAKDAIGVSVLWRDRENVTGTSLTELSPLTGIPFFNNTFQYLSNNGISTNVMSLTLHDDTTNSRIGGIIIPKIEANSSIVIPLYVFVSNPLLNVRTTAATLPLLNSNASASNIAINHNQDYRPFLRFGIERILNITVDTAQFNPCYRQAFDTLLSVIGSNATAGLNIPVNAALSGILVKISSSACVTNIPTALNNNQFSQILVETMGTLAFGDTSEYLNLRTTATAGNTNMMRGSGDDACDFVNEIGGGGGGGAAQALASFFGVTAGGGSSVGSGIGAVNRICMAGSADPNHKYGPGSNPDKIWLNNKDDKSYTIEFENVPGASAPAQIVTIIDTLDAAKVNLASFRWGSVKVAQNVYVDLTDVVDTTVIKVINLQPAMNNKLLIVATYSPTNGIVTWKMITVDLVNLQLTTNPLEGFLPPNTNGQGYGSVSYKVNYRASVMLGDTISNKAFIIFDENTPIITNTYINRYDDVKPQSAVSALPAVTTTTFQVNWTGSDVVAGINHYLVYVSENDGDYKLWKFTDSTYSNFTGTSGNKYEFYSIAVDHAGNVENVPANAPANPDAVTITCTASTAATAITSNATFNEICGGSNANLSVTGGTLGDNATWKWYSGSCGGTLVGTGATININPTSTQTYFVRAESSCNTTSCVQLTVNVTTAAPAQNVVVPPIVNLPAYACNGTNVSNINVPAVGNATQYIWDGPLGTTFNGNSSPYISNSPSINISFGSLPTGASGYYIGVQAANACGVSLRKVQWVRGIVSVPSAIITANNRTTECANTNANYSIASVGGATSYLWSITGDATVSGTGTTVTVNFGPTWTGGTLSVSAQTPCYTSPAKTIVLTTAAPPLGVMSGVFSTCVGSTQTYSVPAAAGVTSYTWSLPQNTYGSSASNAINVAINNGFTGGNISVTATSICGVVTAPRIKTIISGAPPTPSLISGFSNGICNTVVSYSCPPQPGVTFIWSCSVGTIQSGQGTNSVSISLGSFTTGTVSVVSSNACGSSSTRTISIKGAPNTPAAITANPAVWCNNDAGVQFNSSLSGISGAYTLNWAVIPASAATYVLGQGTNSYTVDWNSGNATISLTATNVCGSGTRTFNANPSCREAMSGAVNEIEEDVFVYPNPASEKINVEFVLSHNDEAKITMYDMAGKKVAEQIIQASEGKNKTSIDVSRLSKSIYMLNVKSHNLNKQIKITVQ